MKDICKVNGCTRAAFCKGYCQLHDGRSRRGYPLDAPIRAWQHGKKCEVEGCNEKHQAKGLCLTHYLRFKVHGRFNLLPNRTNKDGSPRRADGTGHLNWAGYIIHGNKGRDDREHVLIVEKALGKKLPKGAEVHHVDENKSNNDPRNLVVCPDRAYHKLLHKRQRAYDACGHADWIKCTYCKQYYDPLRLHKHRKRRRPKL